MRGRIAIEVLGNKPSTNAELQLLIQVIEEPEANENLLLQAIITLGKISPGSESAESAAKAVAKVIRQAGPDQMQLIFESIQALSRLGFGARRELGTLLPESVVRFHDNEPLLTHAVQASLTVALTLKARLDQLPDRERYGIYKDLVDGTRKLKRSGIAGFESQIAEFDSLIDGFDQRHAVPSWWQIVCQNPPWLRDTTAIVLLWIVFWFVVWTIAFLFCPQVIAKVQALLLQFSRGIRLGRVGWVPLNLLLLTWIYSGTSRVKRLANS